MSENVAAALSYVLGWITGVIFILIDRRPYVRFHAAQSIVTFGGLHVIRIVLGVFFGVGWMFGGYRHFGYGAYSGFGLGIALLMLLGLISVVLWIVCIVKAAQGEQFVRSVGPIARDFWQGDGTDLQRRFSGLSGLPGANRCQGWHRVQVNGSNQESDSSAGILRTFSELV